MTFSLSALSKQQGHTKENEYLLTMLDLICTSEVTHQPPQNKKIYNTDI